MTNRSAESTIDRIIEIIEAPGNVYGDLQKIGNLVLNAKSQLTIQRIDKELEIPKRNIKREVKECAN